MTYASIVCEVHLSSLQSVVAHIVWPEVSGTMLLLMTCGMFEGDVEGAGALQGLFLQAVKTLGSAFTRIGTTSLSKTYHEARA